MKRALLTLVLIFVSSIVYSQSITIGDDGIVRCKDVPIGTTQTIFGEVYEVVDRDLLIQRRDEGVDMKLMCVSNVTDMRFMFSNLSAVNGDITNWDVSSVMDMSKMFRGTWTNHAPSTFNQAIGKWDVSSVLYMNEMFSNSPFNQQIGEWDVSSVTDMSYMFDGSEFNQTINHWDTGKVENMNRMFSYSPFNQQIGDWDVSSVTNMSWMFRESQFDQPVGDWDVSSVLYMNEMFSNSPFNQQIGEWDVSSVTNMSRMFGYSKFNKPVGDWDVSSVRDMSEMFRDNTEFNQQIGDWDVSSVTNMSRMFRGSYQFNKPIGNWDVSSVKDMSEMFLGTNFFNQHIGNWNVSSVANMTEMFFYSEFNQPINTWCVSQISFEPINFSTGSPLSQSNKPVWGTCIKPKKLTQLQPLNNSTEVQRNMELSWTGDTLSTHYQIQVFEGSDPIVIDTLVTDTTYIHNTILKDNFVYNWRVRGYIEDLKRHGEWSAIWNFTTVLDTSIETEEHPTEFSLSQNYPNPFNPTTQIQFSLPQATHVRLEVFSITGQSVSVLKDDNMSAGNHTVTFNGRNLSSGTYIYRITTPEFTQSRMMNLIK